LDGIAVESLISVFTQNLKWQSANFISLMENRLYATMAGGDENPPRAGDKTTILP